MVKTILCTAHFHDLRIETETFEKFIDLWKWLATKSFDVVRFGFI